MVGESENQLPWFFTNYSLLNSCWDNSDNPLSHAASMAENMLWNITVRLKIINR